MASNDSSRNPEPALPPMGDSVVASLGSMDAGSNGSNGLSQLSAIPSGAQPSMGPAATSRLKEFSPEQVLGEQVEDLERWVLANLQRDRRSLIQFWLLRVPALSCALLAASSPVLGIAGALPGLSAGVALLLAIDSVWPGSTWRGPMRRALYDLRQLDVSGNRLQDIGPLHQLEGIWRLNLDRNPIKDISPLLEIGELELVSLRGVDNLSCNTVNLLSEELGKDAVVWDGECH